MFWKTALQKRDTMRMTVRLPIGLGLQRLVTARRRLEAGVPALLMHFRFGAAGAKGAFETVSVPSDRVPVARTGSWS